MNGKTEYQPCMVCRKSFPLKSLIPMGTVRKVITEEIARDFPQWNAQDYICQPDLTKYRMQYVQSILSSEQGEVSNLEYEVIHSMRQHELISKNVESRLDQNWTFGERLAAGKLALDELHAGVLAGDVHGAASQRGAAASACVLLFAEPLGDIAKARLKVIYEHTDGFEIARQDLNIRGPGEFLGARDRKSVV